MRLRLVLHLLMFTFVIVSSVVVCRAQSRNLLQNSTAAEGLGKWRVFGEAAVEVSTGNSAYFVVRNGGYFVQDVQLSDDAIGKYAVLIGSGASERINLDGAITGLPYVYGTMMQGRQEGGFVLEYLQVPQMLANTQVSDQWVSMWGIFRVPDQTTTIRFYLKQALQNGRPHNGSAARFDKLGLYLFATKEEAAAFVQQY